jgi:dephospho-CoA kinase
LGVNNPRPKLAGVIRLGVTGGIGTGKSTSAEIFARLGIPVADTDIIAREIVAPGQPALEAVRRRFGDEVLSPDGGLDRARMAEVVFSDPNARKQLEAILHPPIRAEWQQRFIRWEAGGHQVAVVVIPLLFETEAERLLDAVACVACTPASQRQRLRQRGWSEQHIDQRLAAQLPLETKVLQSDFVIWTEPPVEIHERQLRCLLASLAKSAERKA